MADSTVAALSAASALDGTELYYGVQGGTNKKVTGAQIKTLTSASPALVTPDLGIPSAGTLTNCTLPVGGVSGLGIGVGTFLATPSSANLLAAVTDETGTGSLVFATSPTLTTPILGTPTSGTLTNCTLPVGGVTGLGTGVATLLGGTSSGTGGPAGTASPTFTGTITAATITASAAITGTSIIAGAASAILWTSGSRLVSPSNGIIQLQNNNATDFTRLQFGGSNVSFPALKRSSAAIAVRLADDSADAAITAAAGTFTGLLSTSGAGITVGSGQVLKLGNAATTGLTGGVLAATTNATIVITDSTGQAYRIPCII